MAATWVTLEEAARRSGRRIDEIRAAVVLGEIESKSTPDETGYVVPESLFPAPPRKRRSWKRWAAAALLLGILGAGYYVFIGPFRSHYTCGRCGLYLTLWSASPRGWKIWCETRSLDLTRWIAEADGTPCVSHDWKFLDGGGGSTG